MKSPSRAYEKAFVHLLLSWKTGRPLSKSDKRLLERMAIDGAYPVPSGYDPTLKARLTP